MWEWTHQTKRCLRVAWPTTDCVRPPLKWWVYGGSLFLSTTASVHCFKDCLRVCVKTLLWRFFLFFDRLPSVMGNVSLCKKNCAPCITLQLQIGRTFNTFFSGDGQVRAFKKKTFSVKIRVSDILDATVLGLFHTFTPYILFLFQMIYSSQLLSFKQVTCHSCVTQIFAKIILLILDLLHTIIGRSHRTTLFVSDLHNRTPEIVYESKLISGVH